jgi:hypothetical protein
MTYTTDRMADITKGTDKQIAYASKIRASVVSNWTKDMPQCKTILDLIDAKLSTSDGIEAARKLTGKATTDEMAADIADHMHIGPLYDIISSNDAAHIIDTYKYNA